MKITAETIRERIASLESAGELSIKEQFYLETMRMLLASLEAEPVAECQHEWNFGGLNNLQSQKQCVKCGRVELVAQPAPVVPDAIPKLKDGQRFKYVKDGIRYSANYSNGWNACRAAIDSNLVEALRLVQCMLEDYRERNYGDAKGWIRHINTRMSEYSEAHGDDAYSVLHDLLPAGRTEQPAREAYEIERFGIFSVTELSDGLNFRIEQFHFEHENHIESSVPKFALQAIINRLQEHCDGMGIEPLMKILPDSAAAPQQEVLYTCPGCGEQSYEELGGGALRCCDCGEHFTKTTGSATQKEVRDA